MVMVYIHCIYISIILSLALLICFLWIKCEFLDTRLRQLHTSTSNVAQAMANYVRDINFNNIGNNDGNVNPQFVALFASVEELADIFTEY